LRERLVTWVSRLSNAVTNLRQRFKALLVLEGSPARNAGALSLGIFLGCSPLYGFHSVLSIFLASIFRLNPLVALLGSQVSFPPLGALILGLEVALGEWLRYGHWTLPAGADARELAAWVWQHALLSWALGSVLVGGGLALVGGVIAWAALVVLRRRRKAAEEAKP
jgi:uncharacterized protein (DUF2062 family)